MCRPRANYFDMDERGKHIGFPLQVMEVVKWNGRG
jgi:hypothetical protein